MASKSNSLPILYLITDRSQTLGRPLLDVVKTALEAGVRMIQLREKDLSGKELFNLARELRLLTRKYGARLLINDRIDIAIATEADGVHLGHQSISVQDARRAFETSSMPGTVPILRLRCASSVNLGQSPPMIGVSTHSIEEARVAESDGADFITFGPVYFTPSKAAYGQPVGTDKLKEVVKAVNIPVFAIGGMKKGNLEEVLNIGACGVAMISAIMAAGDVKKETENILAAIADCRITGQRL